MSGLALVITLHQLCDLHHRLVESIAAAASDLISLEGRVIFVNAAPDDRELVAALHAAISQLSEYCPTEVTVASGRTDRVAACNIGLDVARRYRLDAVVLDASALLEPGALIEIQQVACTDALIGFVSPRTNAPLIGQSPCGHRFHSLTPDAAAKAHMLIQPLLPRTTYSPIVDNFCLFIKSAILTEFGLYDETIARCRDATIDLIMRCNRRGYRAVLANHAFVRLTDQSTSSSLSYSEPMDSIQTESPSSTVLLQRHPEHLDALHRHHLSILSRVEHLISGLIPDATGKIRLLFECSNLSNVYNGTSEVAVAIMTAFATQFSSEYECCVSGNRSAFEFHGMHREPSLHYVGELSDAMTEGPFAVAIRLIQPFKIEDIVNIGLLAPVTGFLLLDTIALDCQYLDTNLTIIYDEMLRVTSLLGYISQFSCNQFRRRFLIPARVTEVIALPSVEPSEYVHEVHSFERGDYILLVGNSYSHKHVRDTVQLYMAEPVKLPLVVLGIKLADEPGLTSHESGTLDSDAVSRLYAGAQAVLFPTHYEGFGFPIMHALGHRKAVIARRLPVFDEIKLAARDGANIRLFDSTLEMIRFALTKPGWVSGDERSRTIHRWDDTSRALKQALQEARDRLSFEALYERQLAVCMSERIAQQTSDARFEERAKCAEGKLTAAEAQQARLNKDLNALRANYEALRANYEALRASYGALSNSTLWLSLYPVRLVSGKLPPSVRHLLRRALKLAWWTLTLQLPGKLHEWQEATHRAQAQLSEKIRNYTTWVETYDIITGDDRRAIKAAIDQMTHRTIISVVMPVYETPERYLRAAIESVVSQVYPDWELCIADDASPSPYIRKVLEEYRATDPRIKLCYRSENGHISVASNSALALATGDYVALLDHDDVLPEHALYMVAAAIAANPELDLLYSDEDKIDSEGRRFDPYFKSDWNPELILGQNFFSHLGVFRRSLIEKLGGFRVGYEGSQDHDLVLRSSALTTPNRIKHLPSILYHWRAVSGSAALGPENKNYAIKNSRKAVADYLAQRGIKATVTSSPVANFHRIRYATPEPRPPVSLIVPIGANLELVSTCLEGLLGRTNYQPLELVTVVNVGTKKEILPYLDQLSSDPRVTVLVDTQPTFNFSRVCNLGVKRARGKIIGLIHDDIEVIEPDWLEELVSHAVRPTVGAVGPLLYYPDRRIQHAGVIVGLGGIAGHAHVDIDRDSHGYWGRAVLTQDLSAVTAACLVMSKAIYLEVGELDETNLAIAFNDVDLCLRIREKGYRIVYSPNAQMYHHGSASRCNGSDDESVERFRCEVEYMRKRWRDTLEHDPYYNPNLSLQSPSFELAFPPRVARAW